MRTTGKISLGLLAALAMHSAVPAQVPPARVPFGRVARPMPHGPRGLPGGRPAGPIAPPMSPAIPSAAISAAAVDAENSFTLSPDNPYGTIVARNVFALVPIPPPPVQAPPPPDPPPKITANGIMNVLGELEALFKVSFPAKGKDPATEHSYMLTVGQRQDDIEVKKIDEPNSTITFDNHGVTQEIALSSAGKESGGGSGGGGAPQPGGGAPGIPGRLHNPAGGGGLGGFGGQGFAGAGRPGGGGSGQGNPGSNGTGTGSGSPNIYQPPTSDMTPEETAFAIEAERALLQSQQDSGQKPDYNPAILPPTSLTPHGGNGEPGGGSITPPGNP